MKNAIALTAIMLFAGTLPTTAGDLDKNAFNLVKVNKGDFLLTETLPDTRRLPRTRKERSKTRPRSNRDRHPRRWKRLD
jgi:hypothetical protein